MWTIDRCSKTLGLKFYNCFKIVINFFVWTRSIQPKLKMFQTKAKFGQKISNV